MRNFKNKDRLQRGHKWYQLCTIWLYNTGRGKCEEDSHRLHAINSLQDVVLFVIFVLHILVKYPPEYMDMYRLLHWWYFFFWRLFIQQASIIKMQNRKKEIFFCVTFSASSDGLDEEDTFIWINFSDWLQLLWVPWQQLNKSFFAVMEHWT